MTDKTKAKTDMTAFRKEGDVQPTGKFNGYTFAQASADSNEYVLSINGYIHKYDASAESIQERLDEIDSETATIRVRFNSGGGSVTEGWAVHDALKNAKAKTVAEIYGIAASAASFAALGCDQVLIGENAQFMIHEAETGAYGRAKTLREVAEMADAMNEQMAGVYSAKSGKDKADVLTDMDKETWYRGTAAVEAGYCDGLLKGAEDAVACVSLEELEKFKNAPEDLVAQVKEAAAQEDPAPAEDTMSAESGDDTVPAEGEADATTQTDDAPVAADTPEDTPAEAKEDGLSDAQVTEIRAACQLFKMPEKADGFIQARASFDDVRKALWNAYADANAQAPDTTTTPQTTQAPQSKSLADALAELRAHQFARKNPKN